MCVDKEMKRKFGVELEGYMDRDKRGDDLSVLDISFSVVADGSLNDRDDETSECTECWGAGYVSLECPDCDGIGEVGGEDGEEVRSCEACDHGEVSIECECCEGEGYINDVGSIYGCEVVSPPITNVKYVHAVFSKMYQYSWEVDESAGLHIHVDASNYMTKDYQKLILLMTAVEPVMYSIVARFRFNECQYCKPLADEESEVMNILRNTYEEKDRFVPLFSDGCRYFGLNLRAVAKHGTIEFRYFSPQTSAEVVSRYVELVTQLVEFVKHAEMQQVQVISQKLYHSNFSDACDVLNDVLELSFDLKGMRENDLYTFIDRIALGDMAQVV